MDQQPTSSNSETRNNGEDNANESIHFQYNRELEFRQEGKYIAESKRRDKGLITILKVGRLTENIYPDTGFLARSPYFDQILSTVKIDQLPPSDAAGSIRELTIDLPDLNPSAVEMLVNFLYMWKIDHHVQFPALLDLARAAKKFQLKDVLQHCLTMIIGHLNGVNSLQVLSFAHEQDFEYLQEGVLKFCQKNLAALSHQSVEFMNLEFPKMSGLISSCTGHISHEIIVEAILKWVMHDKNGVREQEYLFPLVQLIDWDNFFQNEPLIVSKYFEGELLSNNNECSKIFNNICRKKAIEGALAEKQQKPETKTTWTMARKSQVGGTREVPGPSSHSTSVPEFQRRTSGTLPEHPIPPNRTPSSSPGPPPLSPQVSVPQNCTTGEAEIESPNTRQKRASRRVYSSDFITETPTKRGRKCPSPRKSPRLISKPPPTYCEESSQLEGILQNPGNSETPQAENSQGPSTSKSTFRTPEKRLESNCNSVVSSSDQEIKINKTLIYLTKVKEKVCIRGYNFDTGKTTRVGKMKIPRKLSSLVYSAGGSKRIYNVGGAVVEPAKWERGSWASLNARDNSKPSRTVTSYTGQSSKADVCEDLCGPRKDFGLTICGNYLYATGGCLGRNVTGMVERLDLHSLLDPKEVKWTDVKPTMLYARFAHCVAVLGDKLYAIGGNGVDVEKLLKQGINPSDKTAPKSADLDSVEVLDTASANPSWERVANLNIPRVYAMSAVMNGKIYVLGGSGTKPGLVGYRERLIKTECYDPETNCWTMLRSMRKCRSRGVVLVQDPFLFVLGGDCNHIPTMEMYDSRTNMWTLQEWPEGLSKEADLTSAIVIEGCWPPS